MEPSWLQSRVDLLRPVVDVGGEILAHDVSDENEEQGVSNLFASESRKAVIIIVIPFVVDSWRWTTSSGVTSHFLFFFSNVSSRFLVFVAFFLEHLRRFLYLLYCFASVSSGFCFSQEYKGKR